MVQASLGYFVTPLVNVLLGVMFLRERLRPRQTMSIPLLFFGAAAKRLRLSTMGILQYLAPSLQFLLAVLAFGEPFSSVQLLSFACIWTAVLIYTLDALSAAREYRIEVVEPD